MKPVLFHPEAEEELGAAVSYYEAHQAGLGTDPRAEVARVVRQIQGDPGLFSPYNNRGVRKCVRRRFPYNVFYLETDPAIWVDAVAHQRRKPGYWEQRIP